MARRQEALDSYVKEFEEKGMEAYGIAADAADYGGFIFGSPVYYSGINGNLMSFMDRVFFSASAQEPHPFRFKPAAAVVSARRAGTTSALNFRNRRKAECQQTLSDRETARKKHDASFDFSKESILL